MAMNEKERTHRKELYEDYKLAYAALMLFYPFTLEDLPGEIWREVDYYPERYHISTFGRLKSFYNGKEKILKPCLHTGGYIYFDLFKNGKCKKCKVHRLVAEAFIPNPKNLPEVDHIFNNKFDNYYENLRWATHAENNQYAYDTGAKKSGEESYQALLTNEQAAKCREVHKKGDPEFEVKALAKQFGVNADVIYDILRGKTYKNADGLKKSEGDNKK